MLPGPDYILRCSSCAGLCRQHSLWSGNTFGALYWSDLKCEAPMLPEIPPAAKCPHCGVILWIKDLAQVGEVMTYYFGQQLTPEQERAKEIWRDVPEFEALGRRGYVEALARGLGRNAARERYLRIHLWWAYNDPYRKPFEMVSARSQPFFDNLAALQKLLKANPDDLLVSAEAYRESGHFARASSLCKEVLATRCDQHLLDIAAQVLFRAKERRHMVFQLDTAHTPR
jgi:hypothetical protein